MTAKSKFKTLSNGSAILYLTNGFEAVIDASDINLVKNDLWSARKRAKRHALYVRRRFKPWGLHQVIMGDINIDHKDGDGLNNRRSNLRKCTNQQNQRNSGKKRYRADKPPSSKYKGVTRNESKNRRRCWSAMIYLGGGSPTSLGRYGSQKQAALAYDAAAKAHFGEFARLNFPCEKTSTCNHCLHQNE
jgi:hypothetical protein